MPTRSPDMVNEHRITLGRWEREQVKEVKDAVEVALIGTGVGICAVGVGGTYVAYKIGKAIYEWGEDLVDKAMGAYEFLDETNVLSQSQPVGSPTRLIFRLFGL